MDTDSDGQISVAELISWVKKNSEQVRLQIRTFNENPATPERHHVACSSRMGSIRLPSTARLYFWIHFGIVGD